MKPIKTIIVDLDGTLALCDHRRHFVENVKPDWDSFLEACDKDEPNKPLIELLHRLDESDDIIIRIFSGRSESVKGKTIDWLKKHDIPYYSLTMRKEGDYRPDEIVKEQWLDELLHKGHEILCCFDDRVKVCEMWRRRGLLCNQVALGNF